MSAPSLLRQGVALVRDPEGEPHLSNIPQDVDSFVGREGELARLHALQAETRLLTLVGPGGVGKTRLALRLAAYAPTVFPDGTWLIDLSALSDPSLVPQAVGDVLGVRRPPEQSWLQALARVLRSLRLLLVLDNCEHLVGACAELVDGLMRRCPHLHLLATSLQPLGTAGETIWRVLPLRVPESAGSTEELAVTDAVRLFVARVRAHLPDFVLGEQNAMVVAEICRRLDGLPLALELAAARVESLGLAEVAARLSDRFTLATGARRTAPARHRTLQAALEWSWRLLAAEEQVLLRRLAVFVGGWTLEAAEAVCSGDGLAANAVADVLGRLVSKSLVIAEQRELTIRYRLLETVRAFAHAQLEAAGEGDLLRRRHVVYLLDLARRSPAEVLDPAHVALLKPEEDNVRAALEWAIRADEVESGLRLATALPALWIFTGHYAEGANWLNGLLALPEVTARPALRSLGFAWSGQLRLMMGDYDEAESLGEAALELSNQGGDARVTALAIEMLGNLALQRGDLARAATLHADARQRMHQLKDPNELVCLLQCGLEANELGEVDRLRQVIADIQTIAHAWSNAELQNAATHLEALLASAEGRAEAAQALLETELAFERPMANQQAIVRTLIDLGHVRLDRGRLDAAIEAFTEAIQLAQVSGERIRLIRALEGFARCLAAGNADAAVRLAGFAAGVRQTIGAVPWPSEQRHLDSWLASARRVLGGPAYERAWQDGQAATVEQAIGLTEALSSATPAARGRLSPREEEVAALLARGLTNKQIAAQLVVSPATVRSHVEHILSKLELSSRAQIAVWASQQGLLRSERDRE
ncbi:MAG: AAA family ATPase [Chloroflexi bacterium]|nr:AAA family ATPase [Chloroflexota bacterium]